MDYILTSSLPALFDSEASVSVELLAFSLSVSVGGGVVVTGSGVGGLGGGYINSYSDFRSCKIERT